MHKSVRETKLPPLGSVKVTINNNTIASNVASIPFNSLGNFGIRKISAATPPKPKALTNIQLGFQKYKPITEKNANRA